MDQPPEVGLHIVHRDTILGSLWSRETRRDRREIELDRLRVLGVLLAEQSLCVEIFANEFDVLLVTTREFEVVERRFVDAEHRDCRSLLGGHVRDSGPVGDREVRHAGAEELDEAIDDANLAKLFGDVKHEVSRSCTLGEFSGKADPDDFGKLHCDGLAEHRGFGLDATDAPADDADAADHRRVAVRADERVGEEPVLAVPLAGVNDLPEVFEVHLVDDTGARRDDAEVVERLLCPLEGAIAFAVALVLQFDVLLVGILGAEIVDLDAVVDHEVNWNLWLDDRGILAFPVNR